MQIVTQWHCTVACGFNSLLHLLEFISDLDQEKEKHNLGRYIYVAYRRIDSYYEV